MALEPGLKVVVDPEAVAIWEEGESSCARAEEV